MVPFEDVAVVEAAEVAAEGVGLALVAVEEPAGVGCELGLERVVEMIDRAA
ncbi:hypothetical protein [Streptomyces sp. WZ-12]|uniref:hypothetical protein n=1 Tax=Streptomyces sp. WZ-12 TaxID=3030210 RepID=UPI0031585876